MKENTFFLLELYSKLFRWLSLENMEFILSLDNIQQGQTDSNIVLLNNWYIVKKNWINF